LNFWEPQAESAANEPDKANKLKEPHEPKEPYELNKPLLTDSQSFRYPE
jgi:hypothetical protein